MRNRGAAVLTHFPEIQREVDRPSALIELPKEPGAGIRPAALGRCAGQAPRRLLAGLRRLVPPDRPLRREARLPRHLRARLRSRRGEGHAVRPSEGYVYSREAGQAYRSASIE